MPEVCSDGQIATTLFEYFLKDLKSKEDWNKLIENINWKKIFNKNAVYEIVRDSHIIAFSAIYYKFCKKFGFDPIKINNFGKKRMCFFPGVICENFFEKSLEWLRSETVSDYDVSDEYFKRFINEIINWDDLSHFISKFPENRLADFIESYHKHINYDNLFFYIGEHVSEQFLIRTREYFNYNRYMPLFEPEKVTEEFIDKHADELNWFHVCEQKKLSEELIERHLDKVHWERICVCQDLSEEFIEKYKDKVDWGALCYDRIGQYSDDFIIKMSDYICWNIALDNIKFSEDLLSKVIDKIKTTDLLENHDNLPKNLIKEALISRQKFS